VKQGPDLRAEALAEILAYRASLMPAVRDFRKRWLKKGLVAPDDAKGWLEKRVSKDLLPRGEGCLVENPFFDLEDPRRVLSYIYRVKPGSIACMLDLAANSVERAFTPAVPLDRAVLLILTGQLFLLRLITSWQLNYTYKPLSRFIMEIDPRLSPAEVAGAYRQQRDAYTQWIFGAKPGGMSEKSLGLAVFTDLHYRPGKSWRELIPEWNKFWKEGHEKDEGYSESLEGQRTFRRASVQAWERVIGASWERREDIQEHFLRDFSKSEKLLAYETEKGERHGHDLQEETE
jgi:hypothetical protein